MNARRMEAEIVRDSLLHTAGRLDLTTGGPELDHNAGQTNHRRSIYFRHAMEKQMLFMQIFDAANPTECYRRAETIVPQQALALANSPLALDMARLTAGDLAQQSGAEPTAANNSAFINAAFTRILGRTPTDEERHACAAFLNEQAKLLADAKSLTPFTGGGEAKVPPSPDPHQRARENLVHVLLNHNDFVTVR